MRKVIWGIFATLFLVLISLPALGGDCGRAREYYEKARKMKVSQNPTLVLIKKEQLYKKAIELCPDYANAHNNLGDVYEKQGRYEEAIPQYRKASDLAPEEPYPYFGLGDIYYKTHRAAEAKKWYEKGLRYTTRYDVLTNERLAFVRDIQGGGVIKAETIRGMLSAPLSTTRGAGEIVSITFGEGLIPFDYDKYDIRDDAKPQLNEIGKALKDMLGASGRDISVEEREMPVFEIAGHTDKRGTDEYNLGLSKNRAESVINYLVNNFNIPKEGLIPKGYGERLPLCGTGDTKPCHALNRRVEIVKKPGSGVKTRSVSFRGANEPEVVMDVGFFYQKSGERQIKVLKEDSRLRSRSDKYFIFLRPAQDCYAYIIQEDSSGKVDIIFPRKGGSAQVRENGDYWVPRFGNAYRLDNTKGEEKLYLLVTSWPLESEIEGLSLKEQVRGAIRALKTRTIYVVRPSSTTEHIQEDELHNNPQKIDRLLARVEGKGGWVKLVKFRHE